MYFSTIQYLKIKYHNFNQIVRRVTFRLLFKINGNCYNRQVYKHMSFFNKILNQLKQFIFSIFFVLYVQPQGKFEIKIQIKRAV